MGNALIHEILPVGWLQCNCSLVGDPETREAIVLDPGDEVERIQEILARHKLTVRAIVNTHAHIDHVGGLRKLHDATGAPVLMHSEDLELYRALEMQAAWIGMPVPEIANVDGLLREGDQVRWGGFAATVMHTPGHTPGSLCLHLPAAGEGTEKSGGMLFAGDTLFAGSIGRTDLWGGSFDKIMHSLRTKLLALPDSTLVFPGHGPATTIGRERDSNPFLRSSF
ncbi:MAG: MBL fold metallo-hydrolase [Acidobacteria bacterium]|nr:MBL fold metallo-hydrolase [Acidobacteriota bacterium]